MSTLSPKRKVEKPKFPGANVIGKKLFRVNSRTQVYVDENSTPEELEAIREKHNTLNTQAAIIKRS